MFTRSRELFEGLVAGLADPAAANLAHSDLEDHLATSGRELLRSLFQDHLDLRAAREERQPAVADATGIARTRVEPGHDRDPGDGVRDGAGDPDGLPGPGSGQPVPGRCGVEPARR
jgi:hypothetical protein